MFYYVYLIFSLNIYHSNEVPHIDNESLRGTMKKRVLSDPQKELQSIITHLEEENKQLQIELLDIQGTRAERLQRHRVTIESQLQRLKLLKVYYFLMIYSIMKILMNN